jgi:hypothetical protein
MAVIANYTGDILEAEDAGVLVIPYEFVLATSLPATNVSTTIFLMPNVNETFQLAGASVTYGTAGSAGTIQITVESGTSAPGAGTAQLTGAMSLAGTANTPINGTVIASPTNITAGSRISFTTAGTPTGLANGVLTILLKRTA